MRKLDHNARLINIALTSSMGHDLIDEASGMTVKVRRPTSDSRLTSSNRVLYYPVSILLQMGCISWYGFDILL
jgi:hypothetical protein